MKSIALIGMPGCGKSTIGELLADRLNFQFVDMDKYIEDYYKTTIKELFSISEEHFRDRESEVCEMLSNSANAVISTGGGVVKRKDNIEALKKNCIVIFVDRDIEDILSDIDFSSRPLLATDHKQNLLHLHSERYELYKKYCDFSVKNNSTLENIVEEIVLKLLS